MNVNLNSPLITMLKDRRLFLDTLQRGVYGPETAGLTNAVCNVLLHLRVPYSHDSRFDLVKQHSQFLRELRTAKAIRENAGVPDYTALVQSIDQLLDQFIDLREYEQFVLVANSIAYVNASILDAVVKQYRSVIQPAAA